MNWFKPDNSYQGQNTGNIRAGNLQGPSNLAASLQGLTNQDVNHPQDANDSNVDPPNHNATLEALKQIFVGRDSEQLAKAAQKHANIQDAINDILDSALDENSSPGNNMYYDYYKMCCDLCMLYLVHCHVFKYVNMISFLISFEEVCILDLTLP